MPDVSHGQIAIGRSWSQKPHSTTVILFHQYRCNLRISLISVLKCYFPNCTRVVILSSVMCWWAINRKNVTFILRLKKKSIEFPDLTCFLFLNIRYTYRALWNIIKVISFIQFWLKRSRRLGYFTSWYNILLIQILKSLFV